jgi:hypothetical protein
MKGTSKKLTVGVLNGENLNAFAPRSGIRQRCLSSPGLFSIMFEALACVIRLKKINERCPDWKGRRKTICR